MDYYRKDEGIERQKMVYHYVPVFVNLTGFYNYTVPARHNFTFSFCNPSLGPTSTIFTKDGNPAIYKLTRIKFHLHQSY
jgi:hypothetical protein